MNREIFINEFSANRPKLTDDERAEILCKSLKRCDWSTKSLVIMEELAELSQQVSKQARHEGSEIDLLEEMADVYICLEFLKEKFNITELKMNKAVDIKLRREESRCEAGK